MNDILSQEEIDALLRGEVMSAEPQADLSPEEKDALGEIGNISMGTAATTLYTLLNNKVTITTPEVTITTIKELARQYPLPFVAVEILYTEGLKGTNLLIINEDDVKIITDLLMGGDGTNTSGELSELHLSAIGEVMNQMIGSASTSLATMFKKSINISPPRAFIIDFNNENPYENFDSDEPIVKINFKMEIGSLINSYMMQLLPVSFAKEMVENLLDAQYATQDSNAQTEPNQHMGNQSQGQYQDSKDFMFETNSQIPDSMEHKNSEFSGSAQSSIQKGSIDVKPVSFQPLDDSSMNGLNSEKEKGNIDLILDVPLEVSVELGKTKKTIEEILELNSGSIIELDKMAGEPVDILVNGKMLAKGEVVVIDDSFGVRITDIVSPVKRISGLK